MVQGQLQLLGRIASFECEFGAFVFSENTIKHNEGKKNPSNKFSFDVHKTNDS